MKEHTRYILKNLWAKKTYGKEWDKLTDLEKIKILNEHKSLADVNKETGASLPQVSLTEEKLTNDKRRKR